MQERAKQDYAIWSQIIDKNIKVVNLPDLTDEQIFFWKELMRLHRREKPVQVTSDKLLRYHLHKKEPLLWYSGGLESSVIKAMYPNIPNIEYRKLNAFNWTNPIEPALMIAGSGLGYGTILYGSELKEGQNKRIRDYRDFHVYMDQLWSKYSGSHFISPVSFFTKHELFKIAIRDRISFYSCFSNDETHKWCGKCYKCLLIDMLYKLEGLKSPIVMQVSERDILSGKMGPINSGEISVYKKLKKKWSQEK